MTLSESHPPGKGAEAERGMTEPKGALLTVPCQQKVLLIEGFQGRRGAPRGAPFVPMMVPRASWRCSIQTATRLAPPEFEPR